MQLAAFDNRNSRGTRSGRNKGGFAADYTEAAGHMAVMRLADKRQVLSRVEWSTGADSRLTHTVSVIRIARAISDKLRLNTGLSVSIALCHDVAHCPYAHLGESVVNDRLRNEKSVEYDHAQVACFVLSNVFDLDLSYEVLDGIRWHSLSSGVMRSNVPQEFRVVALADKVAYSLGDAVDAVNLVSSGVYTEFTTMNSAEAQELSAEVRRVRTKLGSTDEERLNTLVDSIARESHFAGEVKFEAEPEAMLLGELRRILSEGLYKKTDLPEDIAQLTRVLDKVRDSDIDANPYLFFALLTDSELRALDCINEVSRNSIETLQIGELRLPGRQDFRFLVPDLNWGHT